MKEVDPVEELHQIRQKMYKDAGGTPASFVRYLMEKQQEYANRLIDLSKPCVPESRPCRKAAKHAINTAAPKSNKQRKAVAP